MGERARSSWITAIAIILLIGVPAQAVGAPANTLTELWRELGSCIQLPSEGAGSELTIVFALKRDGSLLGLPRITHSHLLGDAAAQKAFAAAAIGSLARCLPIEITDSLGGAIAGRPLSIRIGKRPLNARALGYWIRLGFRENQRDSHAIFARS
jgi:hypothetical protein